MLKTAKLKTYVLNLDRHTKRLQRIQAQLDQQDLEWTRFPAIDARSVDPDYLDSLVAQTGPIPRMPIGARACTAGHFQIYRDFLETTATHALVLEDDAQLSPCLARDLSTILETCPAGVLNINRQPSSGEHKKLVVKARHPLRVGDYEIRDLSSVHYGTAGYVIDRPTAKRILALYPHPDLPIDHILFNPNISRLFQDSPIKQLFPALVRPHPDTVSSIQFAPVQRSGSLKNKLKRARSEVAIVPRLLVGLLFKVYMVKVLEFKEP